MASGPAVHMVPLLSISSMPRHARPWLLHLSGCCSSGVVHVLAPPAQCAPNQDYLCRLPLLPPTPALSPTPVWLHWQGLWLGHVMSTLLARVLASAFLACVLPGSHTSLAAPSAMAASTSGWRRVPRQWHPHQGAGTELSPGPRWQGAKLSLLHRPASAPGSTVTSLCFF